MLIMPMLLLLLLVMLEREKEKKKKVGKICEIGAEPRGWGGKVYCCVVWEWEKDEKNRHTAITTTCRRRAWCGRTRIIITLRMNNNNKRSNNIRVNENDRKNSSSSSNEMRSF